MKLISKVLFAGAVLGFGSSLCLARNSNEHAEHVKNLASEISLPALKDLVEKKSVTVIDANSTKSYKSGHIPGAIHFDSNAKKLGQLLPKEKDALIVAYCGGPLCTAWEAAAEEAKKLGYTNIKHLKAGIKGWREAKYPTDS